MLAGPDGSVLTGRLGSEETLSDAGEKRLNMVDFSTDICWNTPKAKKATRAKKPFRETKSLGRSAMVNPAFVLWLVVDETAGAENEMSRKLF